MKPKTRPKTIARRPLMIRVDLHSRCKTVADETGRKLKAVGDEMAEAWLKKNQG